MDIFFLKKEKEGLLRVGIYSYRYRGFFLDFSVDLNLLGNNEAERDIGFFFSKVNILRIYSRMNHI